MTSTSPENEKANDVATPSESNANVTQGESIYVLLNKVKSAVGAVGKNERNNVQNFAFRGLDSTVNAVAPHLNRYGIITSPEVLQMQCEQLEIGQKKSPMLHVALLVKYRFYGPNGDSVESTVYSQSLDSGDKAAAKAMSVAYRIALLQTLNLPTQDEKDPDEYSYGDYDVNGQNGGNAKVANFPKSASPAISGNAPNPPQIGDWPNRINSVNNVTKLRDLFKEAGRLGVLQHVPSGEEHTVQELLIQHNDMLALTKSTEGASTSS
jgi:hypothetical protein